MSLKFLKHPFPGTAANYPVRVATDGKGVENRK
jgi:hypothetical protein